MREPTTTPTSKEMMTTHFDRFMRESKFETLGEPSLEKAKNAAARFVNDAALWLDGKAKPRWVSFVGRSGTGKTHLAKEIYRYVWRNLGGENDRQKLFCLDFRFAAADELAQQWRERKSAYLPEFERAPLLVVDDMGTVADKSGFVTDAMYTLLSRRMGKWTVITSNLTYSSISEQFDERLADRMLRDGNVVASIDCQSWARRCLAQSKEAKDASR